MIQRTIQVLEFDKVRTMLSNYACTDYAKNKLLELQPYLSEREVLARIKETTEARRMLDCFGQPPISAMKEMENILVLTEKGGMLVPEQLNQAVLFITSCNRLKSYLKKTESLHVDLAYYGDSIIDLTTIVNEINLAIRGNEVDDNATKELKNIRRNINQIKSEVKTKMENLLRSKKDWFTDDFVSSRNGHYVLPVKKEFKNQVGGSVLDISSTGSTYFIEPNAVIKLEDELSLLYLQEENEVRRILYSLTALIGDHTEAIKLNMEAMTTLDFIFAKAKLSAEMKAIPAAMNTTRYIHIVNGRHPLIPASVCVPLNFTIGEGIHGIIITGPNTGGKTVTLKTVGLLEIMAQSGLHVPCEQADLCMNNLILCDIGDGQSITENLSTFSAHISNIINILELAGKDSLVLLDELGSGTDPAEGMGIAIAILEELHTKNCLFLATTHYPEIKEYANHTDGLLNAKMTFDKDSLKPLYQLEIGKAGESCALYIAKQLGLPKKMLERAYQEAYCKGPLSSKETIDPDFINSACEQINSKQTAPSITVSQTQQPVTPAKTHSMRFQIGDSVVVYPQKKIGIVFQRANEKGEVGVQIQKKKQFINHKRLKLKASAADLYPEDYDFSIIFDSVENRKARHKMDKGYQEDLEIKYEPEIH